MKITILSTYDTTGGAAIASLRLHKALVNNGVESVLVTQLKKGDDVHVKPIADSWLQKKYALFRFALDRLIFTFYEKSKEVRFSFSQAIVGVDVSKNPYIQQADIIHLHWINFGFLSLSSIGKLIATNKPIVFTLHDMWLFTGGCHYAGDCTNFTNTCGNCVPFLKNPSIDDESNQVWKRKMDLLSDANFTVITSSQWLGNEARKSSLLRNKNIVTIAIPVDTTVFRPREKSIVLSHFNLEGDKKYILFAAVKIADPRKGFVYFSEALSMLHHNFKENNIDTTNIEIIIFGQAQASDFEALPFKVNLLGQLSNLDSIAKAYSAASVFVIPSLEDNLPNTIMESLASGTPVVGFASGGIPEMIDHERTGYLAQYKSAEDLANGIEYVLQNPDYQKLCENSRNKALQNYSEKVVAEKHKDLYESIKNKRNYKEFGTNNGHR